MKRVIIIVVVIIIGIAGWYGYKLYNEKTPDIGNQKPEVIVSAKELIAAFDKDSSSAKKLYVDKLLEINGNVKNIDTSGAIVLGDEGNPSVVTVSLDRRHLNDYKKLKTGSPAVIQGNCVGYTKGNGEDLIESLGTTVQINFAVVKEIHQ